MCGIETKTLRESEKLNATIEAEANRLLYEYGILEIMTKYGIPFVTGSYALGLMTRRDLDINIETEKIAEEKFIRMGGKIAATVKAWRITYMNEFLYRHPRLPLGLYLGVQTSILDGQKEWNIDIWALNADYAHQNKRFINDLQTSIDDTKRQLILEIKYKSNQHPGYQRTFFSTDIYNAVIYNGIKTTEEFFSFVDEHRKIDISI